MNRQVAIYLFTENRSSWKPGNRKLVKATSGAPVNCRKALSRTVYTVIMMKPGF